MRAEKGHIHFIRSAGALALFRLAAAMIVLLIAGPCLAQDVDAGDVMSLVRRLSANPDRSMGSEGAREAADYIQEKFSQFPDAGAHRFSIPILVHEKSELTIPGGPPARPLHPLRYNAISQACTGPEGLEGPVIYTGTGRLEELNGKQVEGSVVLMEIDSGKNWLNVAALGAKALIFLDPGETSKSFFKEKKELTPVEFPMFWMPRQQARELFGDYESRPGTVAPLVRIFSKSTWKEVELENLYALVPGTDEDLQEELVIVESFYDSSGFVAGRSPGADEALGAAVILKLAEELRKNPPKRSVLLAATAGHDQSLAGMRELIWSLNFSSKSLRNMEKTLGVQGKKAKDVIAALSGYQPGETLEPDKMKLVQEALGERVKTEVDILSRELMRLRLEQKTEADQALIKELAEKRLLLRRLGWRSSHDELPPEEIELVRDLLPAALRDQKAIQADLQKKGKLLRSAKTFRSLVKGKDLASVISLHLSSRGDGVGAFNQGWLHVLKPTINRTAAYTVIDDVLNKAGAKVQAELGFQGLYHDTLRPSRSRTWDTYFVDQPQLGGELTSLGGILGLTLATVHDSRGLWGSPADLPEKMNAAYAVRQADLVCGLIKEVAAAPRLRSEESPRDGYAAVHGRANFIRHGELFPDQPAPGSVIQAYQGDAIFYAMVDSLGQFEFRGVSDKKHVFDKVILEGYKFDPESGRIVWAIDKDNTGKDAYRVKMEREYMETDLIMFACRGMTLFNLLEPRSFRYLTKVDVLDARREAEPTRYWYSRIDTRSSTLCSIFLEPGTRMKMTLSDTVLNKKMILLNGREGHPEGEGYLVDDWPLIPNTVLHVARDMWTLLGPRIRNLETHGIFNEKIRSLQDEGQQALAAASQNLANQQYDRFMEETAQSWALASRVYDSVEETQKDVLFGVLFYIALFVPFAFCLERFLFSYADIHKRILAFLGILIALIAVIYNVHPAFQLAYSPMVVILAFFIMGLSLIVTLIIFFRFEEEMTQLQRRASQTVGQEISRWQAFATAFLLGVGNLRRRRLRTVLTCSTLIILTFTIMSFTSVQSLRMHTRVLFHEQAPYVGLLLKNINWHNLPPEALNTLANRFDQWPTAPRVWLEALDRTKSPRVPVRNGDRVFDAQGLVGLSDQEPRVTGLDRMLIGGRWFAPDEDKAVILPDAMARELGLDPAAPAGEVLLWGEPFQVVGIFSAKKMGEMPDLDGEPLTSVSFPGEVALELSDEEMEALESGEEAEAFQSRYQHVPPGRTVIIPYQTLLAMGGKFKAMAVRPAAGVDPEKTVQDLVDRFKLSIFVGEKDGVFLHAASDALSYSGAPNIMIPILISIFIVLNTMIGSVYERKREIGIYTSVGLAPSHVAFLFIAEAMAFAVLSVVLGYVLAQSSAAVLAGTSLWSGITVNYSSLAGVAAMILVFLVVLVSVIYPARVAAQIAIPDVNRSWTLPETKDNALTFSLPILMKYREFKGVGGYIHHYFKSHQDVTHGIFSTDDVRFLFICPNSGGLEHDEEDCRNSYLACGRDRCLQLHSRVWLAPFDFGIMQHVDVIFCPSEEDPAFLEINVRLIRETGESNAWRRINKTFINQLRKQLLIWRSLGEEEQLSFQEKVTDIEAEQEEQKCLL
ncbi:MAG: FtsX-like permease family protein [Pseudomonadota bacterium]